MRALATLALSVLALTAAQVAAAPATPPAQLSYQGVLLDDLGDPLTGSVDLTVRIYDQAAGGTLLYKEVFSATPLSAGTFTVAIGPTGDASDSPSNPLTTSLSDVFAGDLVAGPSRFLELTVGTDPALARVQVLSAPLALRAESAATADTADTATIATMVTSVNGVDPVVFSEIYEHFNFDGGPPNDDPSEGIGDTDGDGIANFVDPDNDNDGLSDSFESDQGSDINLVTPTIDDVDPTSALATNVTPVTVTGTNFDPGLTVVIGSQSPAPQNLTPTSFDILVGPQVVGTASLSVTLPNGESDATPFGFTFIPPSGFAHVYNVRLSTFDVKGERQTLIGENDDDYRADTNGATNPNLFVPQNGAGQADFAWAPSGRVEGVKCVASGTDCDVQLARDTFDNFIVDEFIPVETITSGTSSDLLSADIAFEPAGRAVMAYVRGHHTGVLTTAEVVVASDFDGDDDFSDPGDVLVVEGSADGGTVAVAVDSTGRTALLYQRSLGVSDSLHLAYDLSGDGDFDDTVGGVPELQTVLAGDTSCLDILVDGSDRIALLYQDASSPGGLTLVRDLDGDGDLGDVGGTTTIGSSPATSCQMDLLTAGGIALVENSGGVVNYHADRDGDGAVDPPVIQVQSDPATQVGVGAGNVNNAVVFTDTHFYTGL